MFKDTRDYFFNLFRAINHATGRKIQVARHLFEPWRVLPRDVPIGWPYCRTNSPAEMSRVAKRCPGGTVALIRSVVSSGKVTCRSGEVAFFTTATLSRGFTMI